VVAFTKCVALDVAGANIYVNAIACGAVLTPPFKAYLAKSSDEERRNRIR
jgi:3-oxoacyl-[acyl-carrier protein] reductase